MILQSEKHQGEVRGLEPEKGKQRNSVAGKGIELGSETEMRSWLEKGVLLGNVG